MSSARARAIGLGVLLLALSSWGCRPTEARRATDAPRADAPRAGVMPWLRDDRPAPPEAPPAEPPKLPTVVWTNATPDLRIAAIEIRDSGGVELRLVVRGAGSSADREHAGAAAIAGETLVVSREPIAAAVGVSIESETTPDATTFVLRARSEDLDPALAIAADLLDGPRASPEDFARARVRLGAKLGERAVDEARWGGERVAVRDVYQLPTSRHPYGTHHPSGEELASVKLEDVRAILGTRYRPASAVLVAAGDFVASQLAERATAKLGRLRAPRAEAISFTEPLKRDPLRITLLAAPRAPRARVLVARLTGTAPDPAGLGALRLALAVTTQRALASGVAWSSDLFLLAEGPSLALMETDAAADTIGHALDTLEVAATSLGEVEPSAAELDAARRAVFTTLARQATSPSAVARAVALRVAAGYPEGTFVSEPEAVASASAEAVRRAARQLDLGGTHVIASGDTGALARRLSERGAVKVLDPTKGFSRVTTLSQSEASPEPTDELAPGLR